MALGLQPGPTCATACCYMYMCMCMCMYMYSGCRSGSLGCVSVHTSMAGVASSSAGTDLPQDIDGITHSYPALTPLLATLAALTERVHVSHRPIVRSDAASGRYLVHLAAGDVHLDAGDTTSPTSPQSRGALQNVVST